jgi:hypothetical protein
MPLQEYAKATLISGAEEASAALPQHHLRVRYRALQGPRTLLDTLRSHSATHMNAQRALSFLSPALKGARRTSGTLQGKTQRPPMPLQE